MRVYKPDILKHANSYFGSLFALATLDLKIKSLYFFKASICAVYL